MKLREYYVTGSCRECGTRETYTVRAKNEEDAIKRVENGEGCSDVSEVGCMDNYEAELNE